MKKSYHVIGLIALAAMLPAALYAANRYNTTVLVFVHAETAVCLCAFFACSLFFCLTRRALFPFLAVAVSGIAVSIFYPNYACLFLPPLLVGVVASVEETRAATIFGLSCGVLCDVTLAGTFPCVYTLAFTLAALCSSLLARSVLQRGVLCSLAVTALTFAFVDALNMLALFFRARAPFVAMASVALRETLVSCALLLVVHPVMLTLHRKFTL